MAANNAPNVWTQMDYVPPRGQCNFKQSVLSPKCPCLRFMLHPLKSSSSYECDGCAHHASFHNMENKAEDEIRKRWEQEARDKAQQDTNNARPRKRLREIEYKAANRLTNGDVESTDIRAIEYGILTPEEGDTASEAGSSRSKGTSRGKGRKGAVGRSTRARGKVTEIPENDEEYIELD